ncbi:MAG TPA: kelch repeat-containing protein [Chitinophagaceae bacterium]|nr:kelch repeat-containing protein [Chitinophagaceae bacterium]
MKFNLIFQVNLVFIVYLLFGICRVGNAQVPQSMNYQGIARDPAGNPLSNKPLAIKLAILPTLDSKVVEFEERQEVVTNEFGLYTLQIGRGEVMFGDLKSVKWETGNKYIRVSIDINGGTNYIDAGTTQLLSVPYAMYAEKSGSTISSNQSTTTNTRATNNYIEKTNSAGVTNSTSLLYDNGTSVALGTTTPNAGVKFQVNSATANTEFIRMQNTNSTGFGRFTMYNDGASTYATFTKYGSVYPGGYTGIASQYTYANLLAFGNNGGNFLMTNGGSIGLSLYKGGTSKLKFNADYVSENVGIGGNAVPIDRIHLNNTDGTSLQMRITNNTTGHTTSDGLVLGNTGNEALLMNKENGSLGFGTNSTNRMTISSNGNVGIGATTPASSAILELKDSTRGFLMPRMSTIQRDAILSPTLGLQIINTDDMCTDMYDGANWIKTCGQKITGAINDSLHMIPNTWAQKATPNIASRSNAISFTINGKAYIGLGAIGTMMGMNDLWEYDPSTNNWTQKANFPLMGRGDAVVFVINNKAYIATGKDPMMNQYFNDCWEYDPSTNAWTQKASLPASARYGAAGFSIGGKGYVGLGNTGSTDLNDFWEYDPSSNTWTQKANYAGGARRFTFNVGADTKGYVGLGIAGSILNDLWEYNPTSNTWLQKQSYPGTAFYACAQFVMEGKAYVGTGYTFGYLNHFWQYDFTTNTWTQKANFIGTARKHASGFAIGKRGYIAFGDDGASKNDWFEYMDDNISGYTTTSNNNSSNSISDGAWTLYNNKIYNSNTGNVGIGTAYPTNKFSVVGKADFSSNVGIGTSTPHAQLHTTGSIRHESLGGAGTRELFADSLGNLKVKKSIVNVSSTTTPKSLPNGAGNSCTSVVKDTIILSGYPTAVASSNIAVKINMLYPPIANCWAYLIAPNGDIINLMLSSGSQYTNALMNTVFTDHATSTIDGGVPPYTGNYKPSGVMGANCLTSATQSNFGGMGGGVINPNGAWVLMIRLDYYASPGTLQNWSVMINDLPTGNPNSLQKWNSNLQTVPSLIYDDGSKVLINTQSASPGIHKLEVWGSALMYGGMANSTYGSSSAELSIMGDAEKTGGGSWLVFSDKRLKKNITDYKNGLSDLLKIHPIKYHYNEIIPCDTSREYIGVIAQELQEIAPYMIREAKIHNENYLEVDNSAMTYMLINAVKELHQLNAKLENELQVQKENTEDQKKKIETLSNQVEELVKQYKSK